jgi:hypothetical protein
MSSNYSGKTHCNLLHTSIYAPEVSSVWLLCIILLFSANLRQSFLTRGTVGLHGDLLLPIQVMKLSLVTYVSNLATVDRTTLHVIREAHMSRLVTSL